MDFKKISLKNLSPPVFIIQRVLKTVFLYLVTATSCMSLVLILLLLFLLIESTKAIDNENISRQHDEKSGFLGENFIQEKYTRTKRQESIDPVKHGASNSNSSRQKRSEFRYLRKKLENCKSSNFSSENCATIFEKLLEIDEELNTEIDELYKMIPNKKGDLQKSNSANSDTLLIEPHINQLFSSDPILDSCMSRIEPEKLCDGFMDCPLGSDELGCFGCDKSSYSCFNSAEECQRSKHLSGPTCYSPNKTCDGFQNCLNGKDEEDCSMLVQDVGLNMVKIKFP